jgi:hypothetical protein
VFHANVVIPDVPTHWLLPKLGATPDVLVVRMMHPNVSLFTADAVKPSSPETFVFHAKKVIPDVLIQETPIRNGVIPDASLARMMLLNVSNLTADVHQPLRRSQFVSHAKLVMKDVLIQETLI